MQIVVKLNLKDILNLKKTKIILQKKMIKCPTPCEIYIYCKKTKNSVNEMEGKVIAKCILYSQEYIYPSLMDDVGYCAHVASILGLSYEELYSYCNIPVLWHIKKLTFLDSFLDLDSLKIKDR